MEHKIFESLKAPVKFESKKDLDDLIIKLIRKDRKKHLLPQSNYEWHLARWFEDKYSVRGGHIEEGLELHDKEIQ